MIIIKQIYLRIKYIGTAMPWWTMCNVCYQEFNGITKKWKRKPFKKELQQIDQHMKECRNATTNQN